MIKKSGNVYRPKPSYENHPVVNVSWYGAFTYAKLYGKRLPTEAEWEKAARGGLVGNKYPWGDNITHDDANYNGTGGRDRWKRTAPVGSFSPNGYGLYDMAGNIYEWCSNWYAKDYYAKSPKRNPQGPKSGKKRICRGGSWESNQDLLRTACRGWLPPSNCGTFLGFRCVISSPSISQ